MRLGVTMRDLADHIRSPRDVKCKTVERVDRLETIAGIQRGLADVKAGRTQPAKQVFHRLRRKHGVAR